MIPTLYDIVRTLDCRLRLAQEYRAQGYTSGMAREVEALDTAIEALYPLVAEESENPYGQEE